MKVICTNGGNWYSLHGYIKKHWWSKKKNEPVNGPKKDEVLTVIEEDYDEGEKYYRFMEWPKRAYLSKYFRPIDEEQAQFKEVTYSEIKKEVPVSAN